MISKVAAVIGSILSPIGEFMKRREERKAAKDSARAKLRQAKVTNAHELTLKDQELEQVLASAKRESWLDEYVTLSLVSILNIIVVGGILAAFGNTEVLEGISLAASAIVQLGVDLGFLMELVIMAAVGLVVWRKI